MNNQEAIKVCSTISRCVKADGMIFPKDINDCVSIADGMKLAIEALQENTKLKAEIEKLKESRDYLSKVNGNLIRITDKQDREITKLKDRLEIKDNNFELYCDLQDENEKLYAELGRMGWKK